MRKILGLDLGVGSIGWSLIETDANDNPVAILGMGSRIVPLSTDDANEFSSGNAISKNQKRTQKRTQRKGYDRYQLRRALLTEKLRELGMLPDERLIKLPVLDLWQLRANAATPGKQLELKEIGRVLYHINQKRGYRHSRSDAGDEKSQREYVQQVNQRFRDIRDEGMTIGQHFANKLAANELTTPKGKFYTYRIKEQVFPREAYVEEFDRIMDCQRGFDQISLPILPLARSGTRSFFTNAPLNPVSILSASVNLQCGSIKHLMGKASCQDPKLLPALLPCSKYAKFGNPLTTYP